MKQVILYILLSLITISGFAQKKPLTHEVYDSWKDVKDFRMSDDGSYSAYLLNPQKGDGEIIIVNNSTGEKLKSFARAKDHQFSVSSNFIVFKVAPQADTIRNLKIKKKKEDSFPKDSIFIYSILNDSVFMAERVKSFKIASEDSDIIAILFEKEEKKKEAEKTDSISQDSVKVDSTKTEIKKEGGKLVYWNLKTNKKADFDNVTDYAMSENGAFLLFKSEFKDSIDSVAVFIVNSIDFIKRTVIHKNGYAQSLSADKTGGNFAFYYSSDTAKNKLFDIICLETSKYSSVTLNAEHIANKPAGWKIQENEKLRFSDNGKLMYFGTSPVFKERNTDSLPDDEVVKLDVWSWNDPRLQSAQLNEIEKQKKKGYLAVYHIDKDKAVQIADSSLDEVSLNRKADDLTVLAHSNYKYQHLVQWESSVPRDYFLVSLVDGSRKKIAENFTGSVILSPEGRFAAIYNKNDSLWYLYDVKRAISYPVSENLGVNFYNENTDVPDLPSSYGFGGWLQNDRAFIIYDKYDLWMVNCAKEGEVLNITKSFGRKNDIVLRYVKTNSKADYLDDNENVILSGFSKTTKKSSVYKLSFNGGGIIPLLYAENEVQNIVKSAKAEVYSFSVSDYNTYPDRYIVEDNSDWKKSKKISDANPQISDYLWGSVELYKWTSFNGDSMNGLLYKPENFDPSKTYPMIVYFYEKNADELYSHYTPRPSRSVINFPLYTSNGYVIFIPDIKYVTGQPGQDAYNCIVSGTYSLIEKGIADKNKIGLQGQSWGGYQVAYLVTQTDLYSCAMAGAAVSNMTSAYGGIRWESGNSRMMQYEHGQSRIGATLWEDLPAYIENSPVFYADKINTPLLMMHNDNDGAVPWTQGLELFTAMKRLSKPCWMLTYNGEEHNLKGRANSVDLSIRMMQFFDFYLKDADCPEWLNTGVPAVEKGMK